MKQKLSPALALAALALAVMLFAALRQSPASPYTAPPADDFVVLTGAQVYSPATEKIEIEVQNQGDTTYLLAYPTLERFARGKWRVVRLKDGIAVPDALASIECGEVQSIALHLSSYSPLKSGHYRMVVPLVEREGYFAYEFDIAD